MTVLDYQPSAAGLIRHNPDEMPYPMNFKHADNIPASRPAFVAIGGDRTDRTQFANYYAAILSAILSDNNIDGISIYSIVYDFGSFNSSLNRAHIFRTAGRRNVALAKEKHINRCHEKALQNMLKSEPTPGYIRDVYNMVLRPRVMCSGHALSTDDAIKNIRKLKLFTHCHGAATTHQLAAYMLQQMLHAGFSTRDIHKIQKNLLVIQHSPAAPLENPYFTTVSFASATDTMMMHHNAFSKHILDNSENIMPAYFDILNGNIFTAGQLTNNVFYEHSPDGLIYHDETLTADGKTIFAAERNAIIRAARHCASGGDLPTVSELVSDDTINFEHMRRVGQMFYASMLKSARQQSLARARQR